jgi:D-alanyl-D-alanine carboxypeptidase (penicillin-binding protein 5/6)
VQPVLGLQTSRSRLGGRRRRRVHHAGEGRFARRVGIGLGLVVIAAVAFIVVQLVRGLPAPLLRQTVPRTSSVPGHLGGLPIPPGAQTSLVVAGVGTVLRTPGELPNPIASVTKLMAALVILKDHPLPEGAQGPSIAITPADVALYQQEKAAQDSVVAVSSGEHLSERQALEAALIPSADNIVELLARWDAGSTSAFVSKMNAEARQLGLSQTHYAGPSGVNPATVSTAADQARLAEVAMKIPTIAQIVAIPQVELPVAGLQYNVNADLGHDGIVGVKTGWVPAGGASFVFAARSSAIASHPLVIGAIVGERQAPPLPTVLAYGEKLAGALGRRLEDVTVVRSGESVGELKSANGAVAPVVATRSARLLAWPGAKIQRVLDPSRHLALPLVAHALVGHLLVRVGSEQQTVPLTLATALSSPSLSYRLTRL